MPRFFVSPADISGNNGVLTVHVRGEDAAHISRVLRMRVGESVTVCDEGGLEYLTTVREVGNEVLLDVVSSKKSENEPPYRAVVYQALVKGDRFDTVLQKSTELGVSKIVPVITSRCVVTLEMGDYAKKLERWRRIVYEASKQCGRGRVPTVGEPQFFSDALKSAAEAELGLFCYEGAGTRPLRELFERTPSPASVSIVIGPEGGFSDDEAAQAATSGLNLTGLGKRILRTETAAPFVLSCLSCRYEL